VPARVRGIKTNKGKANAHRELGRLRTSTEEEEERETWKLSLQEKVEPIAESTPSRRNSGKRQKEKGLTSHITAGE